MAWDFSTDPAFTDQLAWAERFVREEVEPLDLVWPHDVYKPLTDRQRGIVEPLKQAVRDQGLWACHLPPELGGHGYGQVNLALLNEILGSSTWAPRIFGTQAPDTGNAEIIAHYGTAEQKARYLEPLLEGEIVSCFSMTEPQGGADPGVFTTRARRDGDGWVLDGTKLFSSNARWASFLIVMAVTDPDVGPHRGMSMFLVPADAPGVIIERNLALWGEPAEDASHALIRYDDVRLPSSALLGGEGQAFAVAQTRLGGGRVHHAMRIVGMCRRALDMLCERALSRTTKGSLLADKQLVQSSIADSYLQVQQLRLLVMYTAWRIDHLQDYRRVRQDIAAVKVLAPQVLHDVVQRTMHIHGAIGVSNELPLGRMWMAAAALALADGPSEVHRITVAREQLKEYEPARGLWPSEHLPTREAAARAKLGLHDGE